MPNGFSAPMPKPGGPVAGSGTTKSRTPVPAVKVFCTPVAMAVGVAPECAKNTSALAT